MKCTLSLLAVFMFLLTSSFAQVTLRGNISGTFSPDSGTYSVAAGHNIYVDVEDTLILLPGTHLEMSDGANFNIYGVVIAHGEEEKPIIIGAGEGRGIIYMSWGGVFIGENIEFSKLGGHTLDESVYSFIVKDSAYLEINNSSITDSYGHLFYLHQNGMVRVTNSDFRELTSYVKGDYSYTARARGKNIPILENNTFHTADSVINGIYIGNRNYYEQEYVLSKSELPYIASGLNYDYSRYPPYRKNMVLEPGVVLKFFGGVLSSADLLIKGTEDEPVIVTTIFDSTYGGNTWPGEPVEESRWGWELNVPDRRIISNGDGHGGYDTIAGSLTVSNAVIRYGAIYCGDSSETSVVNSTIHSPFSTPFTAKNAMVEISNCFFSALPTPLSIVVAAENCVPVLTDNTFETGQGSLLVNSLALNMGWYSDLYVKTIPSSTIPWYITGIDNNQPCSITIESGNVILMEQDINLNQPAHFEVKGTSKAPVVFTSLYDDEYGLALKDGNRWKGITIGSPSNEGTFTFKATHTSFLNIGSEGINARGEDTHVDLQYCTFAHIDNVALVTSDLSGGSSFVVNNTNFFQSSGGVDNYDTRFLWHGGIPVDARYCYWGDESGPEHLTANPLGKGIEVTGDVLFDPWRINPQGEFVDPQDPGACIPFNTDHLINVGGQVSFVQGRARYIRANCQKGRIRRNMPLSPGDTYITGENSAIELYFGSGEFITPGRLPGENGASSTIRLYENTSFQLMFTEEQPRTKFSRGRAFFNDAFEKMLEIFGFDTYEVETPSNVVGIRGTGFYLEADSTETTIYLVSGEVTITDLHGTERTLSPGEKITTNQNGFTAEATAIVEGDLEYFENFTFHLDDNNELWEDESLLYTTSFDIHQEQQHIDTLRIVFRSTFLQNASPCLNLKVLSEHDQNRYETNPCLEEYAWFENDSTIVIHFAHNPSLGNDIGTIGIAFDNLAFTTGDTLSDTIFLHWNVLFNNISPERLASTSNRVNKVSFDPSKKQIYANFSLVEKMEIDFVLYSLSGKALRGLSTGVLHPGHHTITLPMCNTAKGRYILSTRFGADLQHTMITIIQ